MKKEMGNEIMSLFDFLEEGDSFKASEEVKTNNSKEKAVKDSNTKKKAETAKPKNIVKSKSREEELEEKLKTLETVKISLWGNIIKTLNNEELQNLKIKSLNNLMVDNGYEEFAVVKYVWDLGLSDDKKTGFLTPRYSDFHHKG